MERKKFYAIIDQLAEAWYIDANAPVKGRWGSKNHPKNTGPRRRTDYTGKENEPNESSGEVQVLKWACSEQMCLQCCRMTPNKTEEINLRNGQIKCSCGLKYPIVNIETIS